MNIILVIINAILAAGALFFGVIVILFADSPTTGAEQLHAGMLLLLIPVITIILYVIRYFVHTNIAKTWIAVSSIVFAIVLICWVWLNT